MESIIEILRKGVITDNPEATENLAIRLGELLLKKVKTAHQTLTLSGDLGAGKTTFVRGLAKGLGINQAITSPSFNIYNIYETSGMQFVHLDAYRLNSPEEFDDLLLEELLVKNYILVIEWPGKIGVSRIHPNFEIELKIISGSGTDKQKHEIRLSEFHV